MSKKFIALFLTLIILVVPFGSINAFAEEQVEAEVETSTVENSYNKIHFYFSNEDHTVIDSSMELQEAVGSILPATGAMARSGVQADNEIVVTVEFVSDFMETATYLSFSNERSNIDSIEELHSFRQRLNEYSEEYHADLISENIDSLEILEYAEYEVIGYSPFVTLKMDISDISASALQELSEMENIVNVSLEYEAVAEEEASWTQTLNAINAYDIVTNGTYTGEGVRIGVYESGGVCNTAHVNLSDKDITIRDASVGTTSHATNVTSILATLAPDAEFYVSNVNQIGVAWFIEQGCDIVNCSFGYYNNTKNADGTYTDGVKEYKHSIDGVYDYQITAHFITVFKSAGNKNTSNTSSSYNPQNKVSSPGYAYNVITVGGVDREYTDSAYRWVWDSGASYLCTTPRVKPNVAAPFTVSIPNVGTGSGTSYSSPIVAGSVALLMESEWKYCVYPERVLSVLSSTAQKNYNYSASIGDFDEKTGAGIIDLERMIDNNVFTVEYNTTHASGNDIISTSLYLTAGTEIQIGLAWLVTSDPDANAVYVTDYDLRIFDSEGNRVDTSLLVRSNIEMLRITIPESDTYKIVVYQWGTMNSNVDGDWIALTYNYQ